MCILGIGNCNSFQRLRACSTCCCGDSPTPRWLAAARNAWRHADNSFERAIESCLGCIAEPGCQFSDIGPLILQNRKRLYMRQGVTTKLSVDAPNSTNFILIDSQRV